MIRIVVLFLVVLAGCTQGITDMTDGPELRLVRTSAGRLGLEVVRATENVRGVQADVVIESASGYTIDDVRAPDGLPLDTVRASMPDTNRARFVVSDKRGISLGQSGIIATFVIRPTGDDSGEATARLTQAIVVDGSGAAMDVALGGAISVR